MGCVFFGGSSKSAHTRWPQLNEAVAGMNSPAPPILKTDFRRSSRRGVTRTAESAAPERWCAVHIVSRTLPVYRVAANADLPLEGLLTDYKQKSGVLPDSGMVFFANDQDVAGETMVKDLPQIAPNVVVLQAVPPQEAICVRVAAKLALEKNFWDQAQQGGAMSQQSFCTALQALQIPGCDPEQVWSLSMGNQPATDHATFLAHFSAFECLKSTMLRASTAEDSDVQGVTVISLSEPVPVGERMVGEVDCQGQRGFVTFSVGDTMYLQRTFSFLPPPPVELPNEDDSATVAAADQKIDDALGLEIREENAVPDAEHDKPKKGKSKGKGKTAGRPRLALTRVTQVLKDIRKLQASTTLLVPKACFQRLVREILEEVTHRLK